MLIGVNGYKGAGKDTIADILVDGYGFRKVAFATLMKEAVAALWGIPRPWVDDLKDPELHAWIELNTRLDGEGSPIDQRPKRSMDWRQFLQRFGTEMGREVFGEDFWVDRLFETLPQRKQWVTALSFNMVIDENIVIADLRFPNEARKIRHYGGFNIEVTRPGCEPDGHASEIPLPDILLDRRIVNSGTIAHLHDMVRRMIDELR